MSTTTTETSTPTSTATTKGRTKVKPPSLLACIPCRKSHLKCNGLKPICSRCADRNGECIWIDSRRGYREFRKKGDERLFRGDERAIRNDAILDESQQSQPRPPTPTRLTDFLGNNPRLDEADDDPSQIPGRASCCYDDLFSGFGADIFSTMPSLELPPSLGQGMMTLDLPSGYDKGNLPSTLAQSMPALDVQAARHGSSPSGSDSTTSIARERPRSTAPNDLIDLFYKYFHHAHPFVVPRKMYLDNPSCLPRPLNAVIQYLAGHYVPGANHVGLENAAKVIFSPEVPDDGFKVQGLLLYAMTSFARFDQEEGAQALERAIEIALRIGMNRQDFAVQHGRDDPTLQECWRRTWWTLMIFEGIVVVIGGQSQPYRLFSTFTDVPLPGHDEAYDDVRASPVPRTLAHMRDRTFSEDTFAYSSMAYAIEAAYILGSVLALGPDTFAVTDPQVEGLDASITNFFLSLPPDKREVIRQDGHVDECLLVAHLIINWAAVSLHRPRSTLTFIRNYYRTTCTRVEAAGLPALAYSSHTAKALRAANNIIDLATAQQSMAFAPPTLMCGITTAATVHLPAYAMVGSVGAAAAIKERLQVAISALGAFGEIWPRAMIAKGQVAKFAREVLLTKPDLCVDNSAREASEPMTQMLGKADHCVDDNASLGTMPRAVADSTAPMLSKPDDLCVDDSADPTPQMQYDMSFNADLWMENLIEAEQTIVDADDASGSGGYGGSGCSVLDNFSMPSLDDAAAVVMPQPPSLQNTAAAV